MRQVIDWGDNSPRGEIPQASETYNVVGNMNEHQLVIGETTWGGHKELADTTGVSLLDYGSLIYITLERCKTAREAIRTMADLVEKYGYASTGETFSIADKNEAWIMEMIGKGQRKVLSGLLSVFLTMLFALMPTNRAYARSIIRIATM